MPKKPPAPSSLPPLKFPGKTFAFVGKLYPSVRRELTQLIEAEGGTVVENVTAGLDFLLMSERCPRGQWTAEKKAEQLNRKGAAITTLDHDQFTKLVSPTRAEALALLLGGEEGVRRWNYLREDPENRWNRRLDLPSLAGTDFRKVSLRGANLWGVKIDRADFRDADLTDTSLWNVKSAPFDRACLVKTGVGNVTECSFVKANLRGGWMHNVKGADFTGACLDGVGLGRSTVTGSVFRNASLRKAQGEEAKLGGNDFTSADLSEAQLRNASLERANLTRARLERANLDHCDLSGATLTSACLRGADLSGAKLKGADLRKADLRDTNLADADLREVRLDGADLTGANVRGARFDPTAVRKARGLDLTATAATTDRPCPNMERLEELARRGQWLTTKALLQFPDVRIQLEASGSKRKTSYQGTAHWERYSGDKGDYAYDEAPSLSAAMRQLANKWSGGKLLLDSVEVTHKKVPRDAELPALAVAAWCEAFGQEPPTPEALAGAKESGQEREQRLRAEFLAELRGGPEGVERWNARNFSDELKTVCPNFAGSDLSGA